MDCVCGSMEGVFCIVGCGVNVFTGQMVVERYTVETTLVLGEGQLGVADGQY